MPESKGSTMQFEKQLFHFSDDRIRIDIRLGFEGEKLKLDGYDIGEAVREIWGDSDYEYAITVSGEDLEKLYRLSNLEPGQKKALVDHLAKTFSLNEAFSSFREYLTASEIGFESFTWA